MSGISLRKEFVRSFCVEIPTDDPRWVVTIKLKRPVLGRLVDTLRSFDEELPVGWKPPGIVRKERVSKALYLVDHEPTETEIRQVVADLDGAGIYAGT